jgi:hypothetical protein
MKLLKPGGVKTQEEEVMPKIAVVPAMFFLLAGLAVAQVPTSGNVFVGYSFENAGSSALNLNLNRPNLQGWEASLEGKLIPAMGIVADFSGHYGSESGTETTPEGPVSVNVTGHEEEVLFGPRFSISVRKFRPFVESEFGLAHINTNSFGSNTSFAFTTGGGLDYRINRLLAWRFEGGPVWTRFFHTSQGNVRLSTGIVFRF